SRRSRWRRISTTRAGSGSPMCWPPSPPAARRSTPRWAGSAAALMRLERPATSSLKTLYSCSSRWGWRRASIWTSSPKRATSWRPRLNHHRALKADKAVADLVVVVPGNGLAGGKGQYRDADVGALGDDLAGSDLVTPAIPVLHSGAPGCVAPA